MAENLEIEQIKYLLKNPDEIGDFEFTLLKGIANVLNKGDEHLARELTLRALEHASIFKNSSEFLSSLSRELGLFPYIDPESLSIRDQIAYEFNRPLNMGDDVVFHREQADVYRRLLAGDSVILSAPTSFGKSRIIDALVLSGKYNNIAIIVPTLALIDETRRRLAGLSHEYKIVTHTSQYPHSKNIFIFTAERAVSYALFPKIDFFVIDEFYKIGALEEDKERTVALNQAFYKLRRSGAQFYLLGPNIDHIPNGFEEKFKCLFYPTKYSTVVAEETRVQVPKDKTAALISLLKGFDEPTLIFCSSPARANDIANEMLIANIGYEVPELKDAAEWIGDEYHNDWILSRALQNGIGVHHGRLPRSLAQYVVRIFNEGLLKFLVCTSTLIEGVNTKAKNVVIYDNAIAKKQIDYFTFNNIKGRSGRMFQHFIGKTYLFSDPPQEKLPFVDFPLFTQDSNAPDSLLIQIDTDDLTPASKDRVRKYTETSVLPIYILKQNSSIEPSRQIELARKIKSSAEIGRLLAWTGFPKYEELECVSELIWEYLLEGGGLYGVYSSKQLTYKLSQLQRTPKISDRINLELTGKFAAKSVDEAVERVLQFERNWAGFEMPKFLMALSRVQEYVLNSQGLSAGDYSFYASQLECCFRTPVISALDEYGLPIQISTKIAKMIDKGDGLDASLERLKVLQYEQFSLSAFEKEMIYETQKGI